jgi:hypothetical protein
VLTTKAAFWFFADSRVLVDIAGERADTTELTPQELSALLPLNSRN